MSDTTVVSATVGAAASVPWLTLALVSVAIFGLAYASGWVAAWAARRWVETRYQEREQ